jgi:hypothetical protein
VRSCSRPRTRVGLGDQGGRQERSLSETEPVCGVAGGGAGSGWQRQQGQGGRWPPRRLLTRSLPIYPLPSPPPPGSCTPGRLVAPPSSGTNPCSRTRAATPRRGEWSSSSRGARRPGARRGTRARRTCGGARCGCGCGGAWAHWRCPRRPARPTSRRRFRLRGSRRPRCPPACCRRGGCRPRPPPPPPCPHGLLLAAAGAGGVPGRPAPAPPQAVAPAAAGGGPSLLRGLAEARLKLG